MSAIPRLTMEQLPDGLAALLRPRVERLGYLGEFFRCTANQPDALEAFYRLTEALKATVPDRLAEVVALSVATKLDNAYERNQHERLCVKLGYGADWVRAVERLDPADAALAPDEQAVQRLVLGALERAGKDALPLVDAVAERTDPQVAVGVLMLIGRYAMHATIVNALDLAPPVAGIFEAAAR